KALGGDRETCDGQARVEFPDDVQAIRARSAGEHTEWQQRVRAGFAETLASGLIVRGFARDSERGRSYYLFGPDEDQFHFRAYQRNDPDRGTGNANPVPSAVKEQ